MSNPGRPHRRISSTLILSIILAGVASWFGHSAYTANRPESLAGAFTAAVGSVPPRPSAATQGANLSDNANTTLLLHFENSLKDIDGEAPTEASGVTFESGMLGQGALIDGTDILRYAPAGNFNPAAGSVEFWLKPRWSGSDAPNGRTLFSVGNNRYTPNNMILEKDGANNLAFIFGVPDSEGGKVYGVGGWTANEWHHIAITWTIPGTMKTYVDGVERISHSATNQDLISSVPSALSIGSIGGGTQINAVIDELRISDVARTPAEIVSGYLSSLTVNSISVSAVTMNLWKTWRVMPKITANTNVGVVEVPSAAAGWTSSDPVVAIVNVEGQIVGVEPGSAVLTANLNGAHSSLAINVRAPALPPRVSVPNSYLTSPAAGSLYEIPVLTIRYLPSSNGVSIDTSWAPDFATLNPISLSSLEQQLDRYDQNVKFMLEEGSRFRDYGTQTQPPSLGYRVIASITVYEPTPPGRILQTSQGHPVYGPEHLQIFERLGIQNYVNSLGVREIWFWQGGFDASFPSYNPSIHLPEKFRVMSESNMSSPTTDDISNGFDRSNSDLPVYNKSYVVYGQNFRRTQAEVVHNHGHQLESMFSYVNQRQAGNTEIFWQKFVGRDASFNWLRGRAGDTHHPPNASTDYDYQNPTAFGSDIMDWKPEGGQTTPISASTYGNIPYSFPVPNPPQRIESQWYIFWMQSMPGRGNSITFGTQRMTNWWSFVGDWDASINAHLGLYSPFAQPDWETITLAQSQVEIKTWMFQGRTYAYLKLWFPNAGYRVVNWGQASQLGNDFTADATLEKYSGPSVLALTTTAGIYDLGSLGPGSYNFTFKNSGTAVKTQAFTVAAPPFSANPIDNARSFVKCQYRDFLNREADQAGEDFWTDNVTKCSDPSRRPVGQTEAQCTLRQRETTSAAFFLSPEFQYTGYFVLRMYQGALGRQPKLSEFLLDAQFVGNGIVVNGQLSAAKINQNRADYAAQFVNCVDATKYRCTEFKAIYDPLTNQQFVDKLFQTTGVNASASDRAGLVNGLNGLMETRASVVQKVVDGINVVSEGNQQFTTPYGQAFYNAELNRAFVQLEYFGYMRRDPDEGGFAFWLGKLNQFGGDFVAAEMVLAFITSPEYRARFGQP